MHGFTKEVRTNPKNILWENIMNSWISINREYIEDWHDDNGNFNDCAYWYNERASVSILAGAIWRKGGVCLEEFSSVKGIIVDKEIDETKERNGRTDLYFYLGEEEYIVEAKFISGLNITKEKILHELANAELDCKESSFFEKKINEKLRAMAIVFIVPHDNNKIDFKSLEKTVSLFCSLEKNEGVIKSECGITTKSCYIIGKEVEI